MQIQKGLDYDDQTIYFLGVIFSQKFLSKSHSTKGHCLITSDRFIFFIAQYFSIFSICQNKILRLLFQNVIPYFCHIWLYNYII